MTDIAPSTCPKCGTPFRAVDGLCSACVARFITTFVKTASSGGLGGVPTVPGYEVLEVTGRGGMGIVYRATRSDDGHEVALKVMPAQLPEQTGLLERLQREADALGALVHPHIVRVTECGITPDGCWFMAMELASGGDLGRRLQQGAMPVEEALRLFRQVAEAIAFAHERGIAHRDIKPANILLDAEGNARVADFSLAKLLRGEGAASFTLTRSAEVFGTPYYIAPEVRRGAGAVDERADIFSLGVLLHEVLTGRLPIGEYVPASKQVKLPARVDRLIARCLQEDPAKRPESVRQLLRELDQPRRNRFMVWTGAGLLGLVGLFGSLSVLWPGAQQTQQAPYAPPSSATPGHPWQNSVGMKFVPVPGTNVLFSIWETRRCDFATFATATNQPRTGPQTRWRHAEQPVDESHPVTPASLMMTSAFCSWLTTRERQRGLIGGNDEYRLPTDEEWSRAAMLPIENGDIPEAREMASSEEVRPFYAWGRQWPPASIAEFANFAGRETRATAKNESLLHTDRYPFTAPAGSMKPNALGIHDLGGNVAEWTSCRWNGKTEARVLRGGSWRDSVPLRLRLDHRQPSLPNASPEGSGFRVVLDLASRRAPNR